MENFNTWDEEIYSVLKTIPLDRIFEYAQSAKIEHRFSVAYLGIYCTEENPRSQVNRRLKALKFPRLTHRSFPDALFIYAYTALSSLPLEARHAEFINLTHEFSRWFKANKESSPQKMISTFGELYDSLSLNSDTSPTGTMVTRSLSDADIEEKISAAMEKGGLSAFLTSLSNDESLRTFNTRTTFYVRKMLYEMLKRPLDILHLHNLPLDEELSAQYVEARRVALSNEENFHRFVNKNKLFLEKVKTEEFRESLNACAPFDTWEEKLSHCMKCVLRDAPIDFSALSLNLLSFLVMERNNIKSLSDEDFLEVAGIDKETYLKIFKSVDPSKRMTTAISGFVSGKFTVSREFLVLFGLFAGYNAERLNHALLSCDLPPLDGDADFDRDILECAHQMTRLSHLINHRLFIGRLNDFSKYLHFSEADPDKQTNSIREDYDSLFEDLKSKLKLALAYSDPHALSLIFDKNPIKEDTKKQVRTLLSK